jgi:RND family efflux transporter MFP subunit
MIGLARILTLLVAVVTAAAPTQAQAPAKGGAAAVKPIPIAVAPAEIRAVQRAVETVGSLVPWQDVQIKTEQAGTVARLHVDLGDAVRVGTVLAEYDTREFEFSVAQAEADLLSARQSLARARSAVEVGEAALRRARDNRSALDAEVARAASQVEWAKSELERNQEMFRRELIAARDVDNARNLHNVAAAQHAVALNALALHPDQVRIAEAQLESDRAGLRVAEAEVARREAALGIQRKRLGDTTIKSSMAGFVARRHMNAGEYVKENTVLFTVVALDPLKFTGTVPERVAPEIKVGQRLDLSVEAYPGQMFAGQVTRLSPAVEVQTRSLALEARVPNGDGRLRPGFFAKGIVLTRKDAAIPFVPAEAVVYFVGISKVFVVADGKAAERVVKAGARQGAWVEIVEGVKVGDQVAVSNLPQLFDGAPVTVTEGPTGKTPPGK